MAEKDFAVGVTGLPTVGQISKKPSYLITLCDVHGKTITYTRFLSVDKPDLLDGFIQVKGIFCEESEDVIVGSYANLLATSKELYVEVLLPIHRIYCIKNLVFNATKPSTLVR